MLCSVHMLTGAAIGKITRRAELACPVAFASHFAMDAIPHLGPLSLFGVEGQNPTRGMIAMGGIDAAIGIVVLILLVRHQPARRLMLWSAFCACLCDAMFNLPALGAAMKTLPGTAWLGEWHDAVDSNVTIPEWPLGVSTQVAFVALSLWVILSPRLSRSDRCN